MSRLLTRSALVIVALLQLSANLYAGPLDDYYLQQFGEAKSEQLQKTVLSVAPAAQETAKCGMPLKKGLRRDWNLLEKSTQKILAKQLALPVLNNEYLSGSGHFKIHYDTAGVNAPNISAINQYTGLDLINVVDWVKIVADTFDYVYSTYSSLGYQHAPAIGGGEYNIYLHDLASKGFYGLVDLGTPLVSGGHSYGFTSTMELDSSFIDGRFRPAIYSPLQSLQITAAHEYHHAIQFGYNAYFATWYAEATSTWLEDEIYDNVNQLYDYVPNYLSVTQNSIDMPIGGNSEYGRWIFNRYISEQHTTASILNFWETLAQTTPPCGNPDSCEVRMLPIIDSVLTNSYGTSLNADFLGFAKRVYTRDWTDHAYDTTPTRPHVYSPVATYSAYPVNSSVTSPASPSITLPHYSFAYYKFTPTPGVKSLTIYINKSTGIQTALFKSGTEIIADARETFTYTSYVASGLGTSDEVVLLIANTSSLDNHNANFSTDGKLVAITEPTPLPSSSPTGKVNGCFIATAAYGSYLHPQVQLLRNFRDDYLLTNVPGRAFVAFYYHFSPPLADFIANHAVLRGLTRLALTPLIFAIVHPLIAIAVLLLLFGFRHIIQFLREVPCTQLSKRF